MPSSWRRSWPGGMPRGRRPRDGVLVPARVARPWRSTWPRGAAGRCSTVWSGGRWGPGRFRSPIRCCRLQLPKYVSSKIVTPSCFGFRTPVT
eukprot:2555427-Rhodomonas_salina.1